MVDFDVTLSENGSTEALVSSVPVPPIEQSLPRVDVTRGVFLTSDGREVQLSDHPVSALIIERIKSQGKPKIPMIEVTLLGKHKQLEPNPNHEGYQARLAEWEEEMSAALMTYIFNAGVKGQPPPEFVEEQRYYFPDATAQDMKYLWVCTLFPSNDLAALSEAILGQFLTTEKGMAESADSFRRDS